MELELWPGGPKIENAPGVFPVGTDSLLLAHFAKRPGRRRLLDLGCGGGLLMLAMAFENQGLTALGLDISPAAIALTEQNIRANGLEGRCAARLGDLRTYRDLLPAEGFDLVLSNPPYFPAAADTDPARTEATCTIEALCAAAAWNLCPGGDLALVYRPERLASLFSAMGSRGIEPKRLRPVSKSATEAPTLVLVEGRKCAKPGLHWLPPLVLPGIGPLSNDHREGGRSS